MPADSRPKRRCVPARPRTVRAVRRTYHAISDFGSADADGLKFLSPAMFEPAIPSQQIDFAVSVHITDLDIALICTGIGPYTYGGLKSAIPVA